MPAGNLLLQALGIEIEIKETLLGVKDAVSRRNRSKLQGCRARAPGGAVNIIQQMGSGEGGWTCIYGEIADLQGRGQPSHQGALLEDLDVVSQRGQTAASGQSAQSGANDDDPFLHCSFFLEVNMGFIIAVFLEGQKKMKQEFVVFRPVFSYNQNIS
jgi:hypothetical protein